MMKKIMIIGAGDFQLPLVQKAAESCHVILVAPAIGEEFLPYIDKKYLLDVRKKEEILAIARQEQIDGVITDQTDIAVRSVAYVAEQMGLPGIGYETGCLFTDKRLMREKMEALGIPVLPNKTVYSLEDGSLWTPREAGASRSAGTPKNWKRNTRKRRDGHPTILL